MGTDVHVFIEVSKTGKKWTLFDQPCVMRDYKLFGRMAGVRDESIEPICAPKGLPDNISEGTRIVWESHQWELDAHHCSWFDEAEISQLEKYFDTHCEFHNQFGWAMNICEDHPQIKHFRIVFWFDN